MTKKEINAFLDAFQTKRDRTLVVIDYGNVEKWKHGLKWKVGVKELAQLVKHFSGGGPNARSLRRFYYGSDFGPSERATALVDWSRSKLEMADWNKFEVVTKRVKYIRDADAVTGYEKKCDLDVEMTVDSIRMRDLYDDIMLFSGDGDLMYAVKYLREEFGKSCHVFGARDHIGREVFDAKTSGIVQTVCYAEDFEYRLRDRYGR